MSLDIDNSARGYRPYGFALLGVCLLIVAGFVANDARLRNTQEIVVPSAYEYTIDQSVVTGITYFNSSFYGNEPAASNTAYVGELTDKLKASFRYNYHASKPAELTSTYYATAVVRARFVLGADGKDISDVWSKEYTLIKPTTETTTTDTVALRKDVSVPFSEYRKTIDQFKTALTLPVTSEVVITFTSIVKGTVDGTPLNDVRVATVSAPLDQPLFKVANKFDKEDKKQVASKAAKQGEDSYRRYEIWVAAGLALAGLASLVYGFRKQIFKSAYQRELEKIYRYHEGIIIRAHRAASFDSKHVVPVQSFDDMLNLEEEIKEPIVASPAGGEATRFSIIRGDVAYVYTLGKALIEEESLETIQDAFDEKPQRTTRKK